MMIYTCTLSPSLDYYLEADQPFEKGVKNHSQLEYYEAGGKGINVSIVLNNLMIQSQALGFLGGFTRDFYITLLQKYEYIQPNFSEINGHTRINVKLMDHSDTDINAHGPYLSSQDCKSLKTKVSRLCEGDYFVFSGNTPEHLTEEVCSMLEGLIHEGVKVVIDTSDNVVKDMIKKQPFLLRTSKQQLAYLYPELSQIQALNEIQKSGIANVVLTEKGTACLACSNGIYSVDLLTEKEVVNNVGTSDAFVAGFLMNDMRGQSAIDSFRFGACCSMATAYSKGMATRERIDRYYEQTKVIEVSISK